MAGGNTPAAPSSIGVLALLSNVDYFTTMDAARPAMSSTSTIAVVLRRISAVNIVREYRIERYTSAVSGFRFLPMHDGSAARCTATMVSGAPANVSEQNTFTPPQNEFQRMVMVRGTSTISVYRNGSLMSVAAAITGYTAPTTDPFVIQGTGVTDEVEIASISISSTSALTALEVAAYDTTVKAAGSRIITGATAHWEASSIAAGAWVDQIGGVSLTQIGSPVVRTVTSPVFT